MTGDDFREELSLIINKLEDLKKIAATKINENYEGYWDSRTCDLVGIIIRLKACKDGVKPKLRTLQEMIEKEEDATYRAVLKGKYKDASEE